jgi:phytoene/squalene synthetase
MLPELKTKKIREPKRKTAWQKWAVDVTEEIASKDHNNLYITSSFFKDSIKYRAFCSYYAVMRIVDDRVDNLPLRTRYSEELCNQELDIINAWEQVIISCSQGIYPTTFQLKACDFANARAVCESLITAFQAIPVPIKLWTNFFDAMRSDIVADEFDSWSDFLTYAEGATVAPTTIYLLLIAAQPNKANSTYELPKEFDLLKCGRYLGVFAYLGHIIRDLAEDINHSSTRLCITREDMIEHNITLEKLRNEAIKQKASSSTRDLVSEILKRARDYLLKGRALTLQIQDFLENDGRFILELIITMYENIIAKIESVGFDPMAKQHYLTRKEKANIVKSVAVQTGFRPTEHSNPFRAIQYRLFQYSI